MSNCTQLRGHRSRCYSFQAGAGPASAARHSRQAIITHNMAVHVQEYLRFVQLYTAAGPSEPVLLIPSRSRTSLCRTSQQAHNQSNKIKVQGRIQKSCYNNSQYLNKKKLLFRRAPPLSLNPVFLILFSYLMGGESVTYHQKSGTCNPP